MVSWHFSAARSQGLDIKDVGNERAFTAFTIRHFESEDWQENLPDYIDTSWSLIRQENLERDFRNIAAELNLNVRRVLTFKSGYRTSQSDSYRYLFSKEARDLTAQRYRKWLSGFDYDF
jgi:hypothetical protein